MYHNRVYIVFFINYSLIKFTIICEFLFTTFRKIWVANLFNCQDEKSLWLAKILVIFSEEKSVNWLSLVSLTFEPLKFILPIVLIYSEIIILNQIYSYINILIFIYLLGPHNWGVWSGLGKRVQNKKTLLDEKFRDFARHDTWCEIKKFFWKSQYSLQFNML